MRRWGRRSAALIVAAASLAGGVTSRAGASPTSATTAAVGPCGQRAVGHYTRVAWIVLENVGTSLLDNPSAPFLDHLTRECGVAVNDHGVAHPSLPNYLALVSGSAAGVADDADPAYHHLDTPSIFSQLGSRWTSLVESMPTPCDRVSSGSYAAKHNPAVYFTSLGPACTHQDVPLTWPLTLSRAFTLIVPNVCHDMHDCSIAIGDAWVRRAVDAIVASAPYRAGQLVLFITVDENDADAANRVPTYVVAPSVPRGTVVTSAYTHYSLLATTEALLGLHRLGAARRAATLLSPFHLGGLARDERPSPHR